MEIKDYPKNTVVSPESISAIMRAILIKEDENDQDKEHFWSIGLSSSNKIRYIELVSLGILNASIIHPRETFRLAIMKSVASIIICHNHPSGNLKPSVEDLAITKKLVEAGKILEIEITDHIIITGENKPGYKEYYSWDEVGILNS